MEGTRNPALQGGSRKKRERDAARGDTRPPGRVRGRVKRKTLLVGVAAIAVVGAVLVFALGARPAVEVLNAVPLERGYVDTTYAYDGLLCVGSQVTGTRVAGVQVQQASGSTTRVVQSPSDQPPTVGFPVTDEGPAAEGFRVPAGEPDCGLRLLVTPTRTGQTRAGVVELSLAYGPGGLLRRTVEVTPDITLDVTGTGPDPRAG